MKAGILIGHLNNAGNESSLIRTAEALGINLVFVKGTRRDEYTNAQGADKDVVYLEFDGYSEIVEYAHRNNHSIVCIENINRAVEISAVEKYGKNPIFVTGNESSGVPDHLLENADLVVKIQHGIGYMKCLNTTIAAAIVMHDFFKKEQARREAKWEGK